MFFFFFFFILAGDAYGAILQEGTEMRLTTFVADALNGFNQGFASTDYYYTQNSVCTRTETHSCVQDDSSTQVSPISGGDIFLIILFSVIFAYFVIATSYGY
jgi:hypothetical protein